MTASELLTAVDAYFVTHLDAEFWGGLSVEKKTAAVTMALSDVMAEIPGKALENVTAGSLAFKAVAEQAVYLARNYENLTEGKVVTGESVEGISNSYTLIGSNAGIGFRAAAYIKRAKASALGSSVRIERT
ncbi:MAG: hypothetical protein PHI85_04975 [Victivallaceae bacterium]|nr:hypothetical protein [Victivallaceae bacterium]